MESPMVGIAARLVRFTAELTCLLCGRSLGTLDGGSSWPPRGEVLLYRPGVDQPTLLSGWWRRRCTTCGGALMATEVTSLGAVGRGPGLDTGSHSPWPATQLARG